MVQKHDIDIAKRIELATAISTKSNQRERRPRRPVSASSSCGSSENVLQQNINKLSPPRANFSATSPRLVLQAQAVFFNLEESFIKWKDFRRASCIRGGELIRRVRQDLLEMPGCRHFRFTLRFADCCLAEC